jgi:hypothetical protein
VIYAVNKMFTGDQQPAPPVRVPKLDSLPWATVDSTHHQP